VDKYQAAVLLEVCNRGWVDATLELRDFRSKFQRTSYRLEHSVRTWETICVSVDAIQGGCSEEVAEKVFETLDRLSPGGAIRRDLRLRIGNYYEELLTDSIASEELLGSYLCQK
jgi:hypothetical protein